MVSTRPNIAAEFAFFTSAAFHTKKAEIHFADVSLETQEEELEAIKAPNREFLLLGCRLSKK